VYTDEALVRDALCYILNRSGVKVIDRASDPFTLLRSISDLHPDAVILSTRDISNEPGIASHVLGEFPNLQVALVSSDRYRILEPPIQSSAAADPSIAVIHFSLEEVLDAVGLVKYPERAPGAE
jgi:DNA-binding NarL/FixJ family response regulator